MIQNHATIKLNLIKSLKKKVNNWPPLYKLLFPFPPHQAFFLLWSLLVRDVLHGLSLGECAVSISTVCQKNDCLLRNVYKTEKNWSKQTKL